jgi:hypothetical protein
VFSISPLRSSVSWALLALAIGSMAAGSVAAEAQAPGPPPPPGAPAPPPPPADPLQATQQGAADAVQRAYDAISRSTSLAGTSRVEGATELMEQSRNAYQQALTDYQASNFTGARESAMMAGDLARAAEELTSAQLIAAAQPQVPPPPQSMGGPDPAARVYADLARLAQHRSDITSRINQFPSAANQSVHRLLEQSSRLEQNAQTLMNSQKPEQASATARAADALLAACDHSIQRVLIATGRVDAAFAPPPPAPPPPPPPRP